MVIIDVQNLTSSLVDEKFVRKAVEASLQYLRIKGIISLDVAIVDSSTNRGLNLRYNKKNEATDVLSFNSVKEFITPKHMGKYLGEIVVCPSSVKKNAVRVEVSFKKEFAHVIIHGVLHLLGYEHEKDKGKAKRMHAIEEKIMELVLYGK